MRGTTIQHPNFHAGPAADSAVVAVLNPGTLLELLSREGDYWHVALADGRQGYVHAGLVVIDVGSGSNPAGNSGAALPLQHGTTVQNPNFHAGPNLGSPTLEVLHPGISVEILGRENDYWRVVLPDGRVGYIHIDLVALAGTRPIDQPAAPGPAFTSSVDIDRWFTEKTGSDFITWFNANHAMRNNWGGSRISGAHATEGFAKLWNRLTFVFDRPSINLAQFLGLMSVVLGETGGRIWPISEFVGTAGHPGIAYAFDRIPGLKSSYNVSPNRSAGSLFNDPAFTNAFANLPLAATVTSSPDPRWNGTAYPQDQFPTDVDPTTGIILECDFYKFRGRGFIQTTWRTAYKELIAFVKNSNDPHPVMQKYKTAWAGIDPDIAATTSTNAEWDELFQQTDCIVACAGIRIHNKNAGDYLNLSSDRGVLAQEGPGSAFLCGLRINGGPAYAHTLQARVMQLRDSLPV